MTQCTSTLFDFQPLGPREVVAAFNGGKITSDAGGLLLREVESKFGFIAQFANCFTDFRDADCTTHTLEELLKQRIFGLCLGYEDLNDHEQLRFDPLLAVLVGKNDPLGQDRLGRNKEKALAGKSTLNRLELTPVRANASSRYKKIVAHLDDMQHYLVKRFVQQYVAPPIRIVLDVDSTDFVLHGHQLGRFFHGYYDAYCYLPLYIFCGDFPLLALLRPSNLDEPVGLLKHLQRIVATVAYLVLRALRQHGLKETEMAQAQCDTIRVKLLKIGATIQVSVRRVVLAMSEAFPFQALFQRAWENLRNLRTSFAAFTAALEHPPPENSTACPT